VRWSGWILPIALLSADLILNYKEILLKVERSIDTSQANKEAYLYLMLSADIFFRERNLEQCIQVNSASPSTRRTVFWKHQPV